MNYKFRLREEHGDTVLMDNGPIEYHSIVDLFNFMKWEYKLWKRNIDFNTHVFHAEEYNELAKEWLYIGQVGRENGLVFLFLHSHNGGRVRLIAK